MDVSANLKYLLTKLSLFSNIMPYLGYYDQVCIIYIRLCKETKAVYEENKNLILQDQKRIHPYFTKELLDNERDPRSEKILIKDFPYSSERCPLFREQFLCPPIVLSENDTKTCMKIGDLDPKVTNFTNIRFDHLANYPIEENIQLLKKNPKVKDDHFKISVNAKLDNYVTLTRGIAQCEKITFDYYQNPDSMDMILDKLEEAAKPIRHLSIPGECMAEEYKCTDMLKDSVKELTLKYTLMDIRNSFRKEYERAVSLFSRVEKVTIFLGRGTITNLMCILRQEEEKNKKVTIVNADGRLISQVFHFQQSEYQNDAVEVKFRASLHGVICRPHTDRIHLIHEKKPIDLDTKNQDHNECYDIECRLNFLPQIVTTSKGTYLEVKDGVEKKIGGSITLITFTAEDLQANGFESSEIAEGYIYIPVENVKKISVTPLTHDKEKSSMIEDYDILIKNLKDCEINLTVMNPSCDSSVLENLSLLSSHKFATFNLDLRYSNEALFEEILKYIKESDIPKRLMLHVFTQRELTRVLETISALSVKPEFIQITIHCEAITKIPIFEFQMANPFIDLVIKFFTLREKTITGRQLLKKFLKK
ncbi:unnamed protein product [Moneuplotes crassus]|uniref:Uncharacterized protein n=1 Tax=Euplotes crassus TaxID=5936 RepID=A0AAD1X1I5_EUPCR|nr:unnamed protein product [Moneuplotes crassus]